MSTSNGAHVRVTVRWNHVHNAGNRAIRAPWRLREKE